MYFFNDIYNIIYIYIYETDKKISRVQMDTGSAHRNTTPKQNTNNRKKTHQYEARAHAHTQATSTNTSSKRKKANY
jgi:hypothetical protein